MLSMTENPPMVHPPGTDFESAGRWWVAHTRSRHEKSLAFDLLQSGHAYFLPMFEQVRIARGRRLRALLPLFSGYLFFAGDEAARFRVLGTHRVARVIEVPDQKRLLMELTHLNRAMNAGARLSPHPYLRQGMRCRVISGAFRGLEGIVQQFGQNAQLVLQVHALGQSVALQIDMSMVEKAE